MKPLLLMASRIAILALLIGLVTLPALAQQPPLFVRSDTLVVPTVATDATGDYFVVSVRAGSPAHPLDDLKGVSFELRYDPAAFDLVVPFPSTFQSFRPGDLFLTEILGGGIGATQLTPIIDTDAGTIAYGVTLNAPADGEGKSGYGSVIDFAFRPKPGAPVDAHAFTLIDVSADQPGGVAYALRPIPETVYIDDPTERKARRRTFAAGNPALASFSDLDNLTLDFSSLAADAEIEALRTLRSPEGTTLPSPYDLVSLGFWSLSEDEGIAFSAEVCLPLGDAARPVSDPNMLRVFKREGATDGWTEQTTRLDPDVVSPTHACATVSSFSDFVVGAPATALPVELSRFQAIHSGDAVQLTWQTETETTNAGFYVERVHGDHFAQLGFVEGHGTTTQPQTYRFDDMALLSGTVRYRLKQVDFDGTFAYSSIVEIHLGGPYALDLLPPYPNPVVRQTALHYLVPTAMPIRLALYDALGREVALLADGLHEAGRHEALLHPDGLPAGLYYARLETATGSRVRSFVLLR